MKITVFVLAISIAVARAESPQDVAVRVIRAWHYGAIYNATDDSEVETNAQIISASEYALQKSILGEGVPERLRVLFAMHLLEQRRLQEGLSPARATLDSKNPLLHDEAVLAAYLRTLLRK